VTCWNFYFRLFPGAIRSPQIIEFLSHLLRHIPGQLLIVWDGLPGHRSRVTWEFIREPRGRLWVEFLPGYTPELNPVEYLWSHWKQHQLPNLCPQNFGQLSHYARRALRRMRKRPTLLIAFWRQAEFFPLSLYYAMLNSGSESCALASLRDPLLKGSATVAKHLFRFSFAVAATSNLFHVQARCWFLPRPPRLLDQHGGRCPSVETSSWLLACLGGNCQRAWS